MNVRDRAAAAATVSYELRQMADAALRIDDAPDDTTHIALLESALLHVRTLTELLVGRSQKRDIKATDLAPEWVIDEAAKPALSNRLDALDKHLAHLTRARLSDTTPWPYPRIVRETVDHMRSLHQGMLDAHKPFANAIGDELERIDREAALVWTVETTHSEVEASTTDTVLRNGRMRDPLVLSEFDTEK